LRLKLFDADGTDREIAPEDIELDALTERQLLWVDLEDNRGDDVGAIVDRLIERLRLQSGRAALLSLDGKPALQNFDDWFLVEVAAVECPGKLQFEGRGLAIVCGRNFVVSLHRGPVEFLDELYAREHGETRIGALRAESFTASLLDWHVDRYLKAVSELEAEVDRLEVSVLSSAVYHECLPELARLRRGASRLGRMLSPHRHVFGSLARPDFRPDENGRTEKEFRALEQRFERAMDAVENVRELVVGSFELFTTRSAQRTNETMRVLTFVTVLLGTLAVVAGVLGMNFRAPLFETGAEGFWITIAAMALIALAATVAARWRHWL
jgi:Mg2+ and Co2+ transporter CorA